MLPKELIGVKKFIVVLVLVMGIFGTAEASRYSDASDVYMAYADVMNHLDGYDDFKKSNVNAENKFQRFSLDYRMDETMKPVTNSLKDIALPFHILGVVMAMHYEHNKEFVSKVDGWSEIPQLRDLHPKASGNYLPKDVLSAIMSRIKDVKSNTMDEISKLKEEP